MDWKLGGLILAALSTVGCTAEPAPTTAPSTPPPQKEAVTAEPPQRSWLAIAQDETRPAAVRASHARVIIRTYPQSVEAVAAKKVLDSLGEPVTPTKWHYVEYTDAMSKSRYHTATITSENSLSFGFPYEGEQRGQLMVRRHPAHGNDIIVSIREGQILCNSYSSCPIRVAFDDGKPTTYRGTDAADGSSETVFLPSFNALTGKMAKAKEMRVQFDVYQQGSPVLVFDVTGFDPRKLQ